MAFERIMGLDVVDEVEYQKYREQMTPILGAFGGAFGYDFKISAVLKSKTEASINRVFTIEFPSEETMHEFFNDSTYLAVKKQYFDNAVKSATVISLHEKNNK